MSADRQCGLSSLLPMSCQERTQAFARNLNSILRKMGTPGSVEDAEEDENTWLAGNSQNGVHNGVTNQQPTHESDSFYDFDIESPGSPVDGLTESEIARLVAVNGTTAHNVDERHNSAKQSSDLETGYVCASPLSENTPDSESSDGQYYDPASSDSEFKSCLMSDNEDTHKKNAANLIRNGFHSSPSLDIGINTKISKLIKSASYNTQTDIELSSDSLPPSQTSDDVTPLSQSSTTIPSLTPNSVESHSSWTLEDDDSSTNLPEDCSVEVISNSNSLLRKEPEINGKHTVETLETEYELDTKENTNTHKDVITDIVLEEKVTLTNGFNHINDLCNGFEMKCDLNFIRNGDVPVIEQREATPDESAASITQMTIDVPDNVHLTVQCESESVSVSIENYENNETEGQPRVRRCSSLKCGKTPPGTPGNPSNKKIVRFADALGLDLADIRTFLDDIPKIPKSAYEDLQDADFSDGNTATCSLFLRQKPDKCLLPMFQQPGGLPNFFDKVRERQVCLENAVVQDPVMLSIIGCVRVRNLDFHKSVYIRYTLDSWKTYADLQASYVLNSCDGFSDKFTFILFVHTMTIGQRLEFAVRFHCKGCQYWDNNMGANYCFQCLPSTTPSYSPISCRSEPGGNWNASFY